MDLEELGRRVRSARMEREMTLQDVADHTDVSVSMLSAVERGEKAPTVVVLDRIARGLGVPLPQLLEARDPSLIIRRRTEQDVVDEPGGWQRIVLTPVVPGVNFEWIRTTLPAGCDAGEFPAYAAGSHEYVAVESGSVRLTIGDSTVDLAAGDSVYFAADTTHAYANVTALPCTYYVAALTMRPRTATRRGNPGRPR